jgi:hypothetical protein
VVESLGRRLTVATDPSIIRNLSQRHDTVMATWALARASKPELVAPLYEWLKEIEAEEGFEDTGRATKPEYPRP